MVQENELGEGRSEADGDENTEGSKKKLRGRWCSERAPGV